MSYLDLRFFFLNFFLFVDFFHKPGYIHGNLDPCGERGMGIRDGDGQISKWGWGRGAPRVSIAIPRLANSTGSICQFWPSISYIYSSPYQPLMCALSTLENS